MKFKQNTTVIFNAQALTVFDAVDSTYKTVQGTEGTLTSGIEGAHSPSSLHYRGLAWDFRLPTLSSHNDKVIQALRTELTATYYDILLERDHIHIEYDPKMRR
jgi:hypothetical protein